jgi:hypothetical protein
MSSAGWDPDQFRVAYPVIGYEGSGKNGIKKEPLAK